MTSDQSTTATWALKPALSLLHTCASGGWLMFFNKACSAASPAGVASEGLV